MGRATLGTNSQNGFGTLADFAVSAAALNNTNNSRKNDQASALLNEAKMVGETKKNDFIANQMAGAGSRLDGNTLAQQYSLHGLTAPKLTSVQGNVGVSDYRPIEQQTFPATPVGASIINKNDAAATKSLADAADNTSGKWTDDYTTTIRKEWKAEPTYKMYQGMSAAQNRLEAMLEQSRNGTSNIADQSLLTMYAKILDPESVVRGSEVDALVSSTGMRGMFQNLISKMASNGRLSTKDRKAFIDASRALYKAAEKDALKTQGVYQDKAKGGGRGGDVIWNPVEAREFDVEENARREAENSLGDSIAQSNPTWTEDQVLDEMDRILATQGGQ